MPYVNHIPRLRRHKPSEQAIVTLNGRDCYLGAWPAGKRKPPDGVRATYDRTIAEWLAGGRQLPASSAAQAPSMVATLAVAFVKHAEQHYRRPDGTQTSELREYKMALRPAIHLYGNVAAADFGPLAFKAVRQLMVDGYMHSKYGLEAAVSRGVVNQRSERLRRVFKWGVENELVPPAVLQGLQAVRGLQRGRTTARETEPVRPVAVAVVEETLPFLNRHLAAMVRLQLLTGARLGEACLRGSSR